MSKNKDFLEIIKFKGINEILNSLQIFSKRYNDLKSSISNKISSRTLDQRLKDLFNLGLITKRERSTNHEEIYEYHLTKSGKVLVSILFSIKQASSDWTIENFLVKFRNHHGYISNYGWDSTWKQLKLICKEKKVIYTLSKNSKKNTIVDISEKGLMVETKKEEERKKAFIPVDKIKKAYRFLLKDGKLSLNDHDKSTYRSSFICALLSKLNWVSTNYKRPIFIYIEN